MRTLVAFPGIFFQQLVGRALDTFAEAFSELRSILPTITR